MSAMIPSRVSPSAKYVTAATTSRIAIGSVAM
jgi:hypothetical protein